MVGIMKFFQPPVPLVGSQPRLTAKIHIIIRPSQKLGTDWPSRAKILDEESKRVSRRTALNTPSGTPIRVARSREAPARLSVLGRRFHYGAAGSQLRIFDGVSQVALKDIPYVDTVLDYQGLVQAQPDTEPLVVLRCSVQPQYGGRRVACEAAQAEYYDGNSDQGNEALAKPYGNETLHSWYRKTSL